MPKIFISYRRADTGDVAGRIHEHLVNAFGKDQVFQDVDDIPTGVDFPEHLDKELSETDVVLVLIGRVWASIKDDAGNQRLKAPNDFVRIEVERALSDENIIIMPVLINDTGMPSTDDIPNSIADVTRINAAIVRRNPDFENDMQRLISEIDESNLAQSTRSTTHTMKRIELLLRNNNLIELKQVIRNINKNAISQILNEDFLDPIQQTSTIQVDSYAKYIPSYFEILEPLLASIYVIGEYGGEEAQKIIKDCINDWVRSEKIRLGFWYYLPVLLIMYTAGMAAIKEQNWIAFLYIFKKPMPRKSNYDSPQQTFIEHVVKYTTDQYQGFAYDPDKNLGDYIKQPLFHILNQEFDSESEFNKYFDSFEILFSVIYLRLASHEDMRWDPVVAHTFHGNRKSYTHLEYFWQEAGNENDDWELIKLGIFENKEQVASLLYRIGKTLVNVRGFPLLFEVYYPNFDYNEEK